MQKLTTFLLSACIVMFCMADRPAANNTAIQSAAAEGILLAKSEGIQWMSLPDAAGSLRQAKKPVLIDLYTDWCSWCKVMDKKTYSNKQVAEYVQNKFYPVRINAESREDIVWNGKTYHYNTKYKANDFALFITQGKLAFPTTVIIPADGSEAQAIPGYLETKDFELIARYFGDGGYGKIPFDQFQKDFKASW